MADTETVETIGADESPIRKRLKDFDPELSATFNEAFPGEEFEDFLYRRAEKGLLKPKAE